MKYDLLGIIEDMIPSLKGNLLARKILKDLLAVYNKNVYCFDKGIIKLENNDYIKYDKDVKRVDIVNNIFGENQKSSISIYDEKHFTYSYSAFIKGEDNNILQALTLSFADSKISKVRLGIWYYDLLISDEEYISNIDEFFTIDQTLDFNGYEDFVNIQNNLHNAKRLLPDFYERHEIDLENNKYRYKYNIDGYCDNEVLKNLENFDFVNIINREIENSKYLTIIDNIKKINEILTLVNVHRLATTDEEKILRAMKFYLKITELMDIVRTGFDKDHWNVRKDRLESIAEHSFKALILALSMYSNFDYKHLDLDKIIMMLIIHEFGETEIGDIPEFDKRKETKDERELAAFKDIVAPLPIKDELIELFIEFNERETKEAQFAYCCDKLDCDITSKIYEDNGYNHLDDQENNPCFLAESTQETLRRGFSTVADCFIEYDAKRIKNDENFTKVLRYIQKHNTNDIKK